MSSEGKCHTVDRDEETREDEGADWILIEDTTRAPSLLEDTTRIQKECFCESTVYIPCRVAAVLLLSSRIC